MLPPRPPASLALALALAVCGLGAGPLAAQQWDGEPSPAVEKASRLAGELQYAEAVRLLELALLEGDTSEQLRSDLAGYYQLTGDLRKATALTKPLADRDRPRPWHLLQIAGMLVDQGRLTEAEEYLRRFEGLKPEDPRAERLRERGRRRADVRPLYPGARLDTFPHNTLADDGFPFVRRDSAGVPDALYWASDRRYGRSASGWTGRAMVGLYAVPLGGDPAAGAAATPQRLEGRFNRGAVNVASPWLTPSGDTLFYSSNARQLNRDHELNMQLYYVVRRRDGEAGGPDLGDWRDPVRLPTQPPDPSCVHPTLSADGRWLYYAADAADSRGGLDLYRVERRRDGSWGRPRNLGGTVNTDRHDAFPVAARDGALYFASQGHANLGGFDVFVTRERPDGTWVEPRNLGEPVNGEFDETGWLPVRLGYAYLVSDRDGGDDDLYEVRY